MQILALSPHTAAKGEVDVAAPLVSRGYGVAFALVTCLFFMWAIANNFNDILIKQFQKALELTRMQSGLVQTAFYFGYFTMALPAGRLIGRIGYKNGILVGLGLYAAGALLFFPAATVRNFGVFLFALYVIAAGLAFLETAANPFVMIMGPTGSAPRRLNLAQSFNGFGGFLAPFIGGALIFSGDERSASALAAMSPAAVEAYRNAAAHAVQLPYLGLAGVVLTLAAIVWLTRFPAVPEEGDGGDKIVASATSLWRFGHFRAAVVAQFFYVGAQVVTWSYFINFAQDAVGAQEKVAAHWLGFSLMGFMIGRFVGTGLMRFVAPQRLLVLYGLMSIILCSFAVLSSGWAALGALAAVSFFMSIMFPTIFALGIEGLGQHTKLGSSFLIMAIVGGALLPPVAGLIADRCGSVQWGMVVPLVCFVVVTAFGVSVSRMSPRHAGERYG